MQLNIRAFTISFTLLMTLLMLVITVWARLSLGFGMEFLDAFNSLHPHPFRASSGTIDLLENLYGVGFDLFYTFVDSLIFSLAFSLLYNRLARPPRQNEEEESDQEREAETGES